MSNFFKVVTPPTELQFLQMLKMQDTLNSRIRTDWKDQNWYLNIAFADEVMEFLGHLGWKWWKDTASYQKGIQDDNIRQLQLEMVDMFHFFLSSELVYEHREKLDPTVRAIELEEFFLSCKKEMADTVDSGDSVELDPIEWALPLLSDVTARDSSGRGAINGEAFYALLCLTGLDGADLFATYLGKFCLNKFRWDNGYADGTYMKHWMIPEVTIMSQEDNWYLELILDDYKLHSIEPTEAKILGALQNYYDRTTGKTSARH